MIGNMGMNEIEMLNAYQYLGSSARKELKEYMRYLLSRQYKREAMSTVFNNKLLHSLFQSLLRLVERNEVDVEQVRKRIFQIKELYYSLFEQVHCRFAEVIEELDSNEVVKDFGRNSFDNLERVLETRNIHKIRMEVINVYQEYINLSRKKDARRIVAV